MISYNSEKIVKKIAKQKLNIFKILSFLNKNNNNKYTSF